MMRVFDTYAFNLADRVTFAKAAAYLTDMLAETGFTAPKTAFSVYATGESVPQKAAEACPFLCKYAQKGDGTCGFTSADTDPAACDRGKIFAEESDRAEICALFAKIPHRLNIPFCTLIFGGIRWFQDSRDDAVPESRSERRFRNPFLIPGSMYCNSVRLSRSYDDGRKLVSVSLCIEVTGEDAPRDPSEILAKLAPYLGEPELKNRVCVFDDAAEWERLHALEQTHRTALSAQIRAAMPAPINPSAGMRDAEQHAKTALLDRIFRGTGFIKQKGYPGWLSCYACTDAHGFCFEAYVQRVSAFGEFRVWLEVTGCNFTMRELPFPSLDYAGTDPETAKSILSRFAACCVSARDTYAAALAEDFGNTPDWFRE